MKVDRWLEGYESRREALEEVRKENETRLAASMPQPRPTPVRPPQMGAAMPPPLPGHARPEPRRRGPWGRRILVGGIVLGVLALSGVVVGIYHVADRLGSAMGGFGSTQQVTQGNVPASIPVQMAGAGSQSVTGGNAPATVAGQPVQARSRQVVDVLPVVLALNGPDGPQPPTRFNSGRVSSVGAAPTANSYGDRVVIKAAAMGNSVIASPAVRDDKVFFGGGFNSHGFHAAHAKTGQPLWSVTLSDNGPSFIAVSNDTVVVNTESCTLYGIETDTGRHKWSKYLGDPLVSSPAVGDGMVVTTYPVMGGPTVKLTGVPAGMRDTFHASHALAAMDVQTGAIKWQALVDGEAMTAPVIADGKVHMASLSGTRYVFDLKTGAPLQAHYDRVTSQPAVDGDLVYYTARDDQGGKPHEAVMVASISDARPVQPLFTQPAAYLSGSMDMTAQQMDAQVGWGGGAPASVNAGLAEEVVGVNSVMGLQLFEGSRLSVADGKLYTTMGHRLVCLDAASGALVWEHELAPAGMMPGWLASPPTVCDGKVYIGTGAGMLMVFDAATGRKEVEEFFGAGIRNHVVVDDKRVYFGNSNGEVVIARLQ